MIVNFVASGRTWALTVNNDSLPFVLVRQIVPAVHVVKFRGQRLAAALPESAAAAAADRLRVVAKSSSGTAASSPEEGSLIAPERRVSLVVHGPPGVVSRPKCDH